MCTFEVTQDSFSETTKSKNRSKIRVKEEQRTQQSLRDSAQRVLRGGHIIVYNLSFCSRYRKTQTIEKRRIFRHNAPEISLNWLFDIFL